MKARSWGSYIGSQKLELLQKKLGLGLLQRKIKELRALTEVATVRDGAPIEKLGDHTKEANLGLLEWKQI